MEKKNNKPWRKLSCHFDFFSWSQIYMLAVFAILLFYMAYNLHVYLFNTLFDTYYLLAVPVFITLYYCREGLRGGLEVKLVSYFGLWVFITRLLCGDLFLQKDLGLVMDVFLACAILGMGISIDRLKGLKFIDTISILFCLFYTTLSVVCIYTAVFQCEIYNPFSEWYLAYFGINRLFALSNSPNRCCVWFFMSIFLAVYLFFRRKEWYLRLPLCFVMLLNFIALALTFSRNMKVGFSIASSMLLILLAFEYLPIKKIWHKVFSIFLILCLVFPLAYKSFDLATFGVNKSAEFVLQENTVEQGDMSTQVEAVGNDSEIYARNHSLLHDTGRIDIYKSIFWSLKEEPLRLFRGSLTEDISTVTKEYIKRFQYGHIHNTFLEILFVTGIPGFVLAMAFFLLIVRHCIRLFFVTGTHMSIKILTIIITGLFSYNMLESSLFCVTDVGSISFFIIAGILISYSRALDSKQES